MLQNLFSILRYLSLSQAVSLLIYNLYHKIKDQPKIFNFLVLKAKAEFRYQIDLHKHKPL